MSKTVSIKGPLVKLSGGPEQYKSDLFAREYFGDLYQSSKKIRNKYSQFLHANNKFHEYVKDSGGEVRWNDDIPPHELYRLVDELAKTLKETSKLGSEIEDFIESEMAEDGIIRGRKRADLKEEMSSAWKKLWNRVARWSVASAIIILGYSTIVCIAEMDYFKGFIKIPALHTIEKITGS